MASETDLNGAREMDVKVIQDFIHAMNVAAGKLLAYPEGHPFVVESFAKVENILASIFAGRSQFTLIIAKNTIMLGSSALDSQNVIFQRFARTLFDHGIVGLILQRGLDTVELMAFNRIISQKRNDVHRRGGIETLLLRENIRHIQLRLIDYGLFQMQEGLDEHETGKEEDRSASFWEKFVRGFFEGTLDPNGLSEGSGFDMNPEALAAMVNDEACHGGKGEIGSAFHSCLRHFDVLQLTGDKMFAKRVAQFVKSLNSDLRQRFLEIFFQALPVDDQATGDILAGMPAEIILDALERHTSQGLYIPPNILRISQKLAKISHNTHQGAAETLLNNYSREELADKLKIIFKEDEADQFIPADYQQMLQQMITAEQITLPESSDMPPVMETLTEQGVAAGFTAVLVDIISGYDEGESLPAVLIESLKERFHLLIRDADFAGMCTILEAVGKKRVGPPDDPETPLRNLTDAIADRDFTYEVLKVFSQVSPEKHPEITKLIVMVGSAFIDPLLDRLAEEGNKALRLYYLNLFKQLGVSVKEHVLKRMRDKRWYFVRNLLIILRQLNDPSVVEAVHALFSHSHPRVRQELLHTLLALRDSEADRILLEELNSPDADRCLKAIALAGMASNREIALKLAGFLKKRGLDKIGFDIKKASIQALADMGDPSVLPVLSDVLGSFFLFSRRNAHLLKLEIIESLGKYPAADAAPILRKISRGRPHVLASRALQAMKTLKVDQP